VSVNAVKATLEDYFLEKVGAADHARDVGVRVEE
jgi:hypothetical protein